MIKNILGPLATLTVLVVILITCSDLTRGHSLSEARELLAQHGALEHKIALSECVKLIEKGDDAIFFGDDIPTKLQALSPYYVRASEHACEITLYKVPGKGIGYWVKKSSTNGGYQLSWADFFESWEVYPIEVEQ